MEITQNMSELGKCTGFVVKTDKDRYLAKKVIITAGGMASKCHGSNGACFDILKSLGHTIIKPVPALTWLKIEEKYTKLWAGVRVNGKIKAYDENKNELAEDSGELQLVSTGISGIPVFQISRYISRQLEKTKRAYIEADFLTEFSKDELLGEILRRRQDEQELEVSYILEGIMNNKLVDAILSRAGINKNSKLKDLTTEQCEQICSLIKKFEAEVKDTAGFDNAQVTCGGVSKIEVNFKNMSSKICKGLYLAGEIVDVDGICGGYNLQWAWSSGYIAGISAAGGK